MTSKPVHIVCRKQAYIRHAFEAMVPKPLGYMQLDHLASDTMFLFTDCRFSQIWQWRMRLHLFDACSSLSTLLAELARDLFLRSVPYQRVQHSFALKRERETLMCLALLGNRIRTAPAVWSCKDLGVLIVPWRCSDRNQSVGETINRQTPTTKLPIVGPETPRQRWVQLSHNAALRCNIDRSLSGRNVNTPITRKVLGI